MSSAFDRIVDQFDPRFKTFHELMKHKVREILLISSPYDAWIMEEDCRLSEAIVNEYRGLNLSHVLTWCPDHPVVVSSHTDGDRAALP